MTVTGPTGVKPPVVELQEKDPGAVPVEHAKEFIQQAKSKVEDDEYKNQMGEQTYYGTVPPAVGASTAANPVTRWKPGVYIFGEAMPKSRSISSPVTSPKKSLQTSAPEDNGENDVENDCRRKIQGTVSLTVSQRPVMKIWNLNQGAKLIFLTRIYQK
ncbi:unnamed protein product [Orchesella dallaii]|uniref:Uncharacterized protein n=1 Tax=Orchesella dallaii TaxID=48710 RepID=A0ABP1QNZ4_9HEXA